MNYREYREKRRRDPEYREVEKRLKPILDLADDVFRLRMERGWTQAELAQKVGTRQANISRLENGSANPTLGFLQKLSEVFETELAVHLQPQLVEIHTKVINVSILQPVRSYEVGDTYEDLFCASAQNITPSIQHKQTI
jgi:transcriptional regulator with XRE-family HTH domain